MTDKEGFIIEAALNNGFEIIDDDVTMFKCSDKSLISFVSFYLNEIEKLKTVEPGKLIAELEAEYNRKTNDLIERHSAQLNKIKCFNALLKACYEPKSKYVIECHPETKQHHCTIVDLDADPFVFTTQVGNLLLVKL